jgi:hypothetical protein
MDWPQVGQAILNLRVELWLAALGLLLAAQAVSALRWKLLAGALGFERPWRQLTGMYFIGMYFNLLLPTSVGGDVVRAWYLDGRSGRKLAAFATVLLDRVSGLVVLLAMSCVALLLTPLELPPWVPWFVWGAAGCALLGLASLPLAAGRGRNGAQRLRRVRAALAAVRSPRVLLGTTLLSLCVQVAGVAIVWLVGLAIQAPVPGAYYWIMVPMVSLLTLLPISVNGMGVREGGAVLFLAPFGVSESAAVTLAFLWFVVYATASLAGGVVYLFGRFPRPTPTAEISDEGQSDHGPVGGDPDQGRAGQPKAAA